MSKIRQAVSYERRLSDAKIKAHIDRAEIQLRAEADLRKMSIKYERMYTDGQFGQLNLVAQEHRVFHEREHLLYEDAIEKAATSLSSGLAAIQLDVDRFREDATKWITVERFEREHTTLEEKTVLALETLSTKIDASTQAAAVARQALAEKIGAEEKVTVRAQAQDELLSQMASNASTSRRWMIGLIVTITIFGITTLIGLGTSILHVFKII